MKPKQEDPDVTPNEQSAEGKVEAAEVTANEQAAEGKVESAQKEGIEGAKVAAPEEKREKPAPVKRKPIRRRSATGCQTRD